MLGGLLPKPLLLRRWRPSYLYVLISHLFGGRCQSADVLKLNSLILVGRFHSAMEYTVACRCTILCFVVFGPNDFDLKVGGPVMALLQPEELVLLRLRL